MRQLLIAIFALFVLSGCVGSGSGIGRHDSAEGAMRNAAAASQNGGVRLVGVYIRDAKEYPNGSAYVDRFLKRNPEVLSVYRSYVLGQGEPATYSHAIQIKEDIELAMEVGLISQVEANESQAALEYLVAARHLDGLLTIRIDNDLSKFQILSSEPHISKIEQLALHEISSGQGNRSETVSLLSRHIAAVASPDKKASLIKRLSSANLFVDDIPRIRPNLPELSREIEVAAKTVPLGSDVPAAVLSAREVVKEELKDPITAQFRNDRVVVKEAYGAVCGEVIAKNSYGAFTGWKRYFVRGKSARMQDSGQAPDFDISYIEYC